MGAFAATTLAAAPTYGRAAGFLRGAGDIRRIRMYNGRTGESHRHDLLDRGRLHPDAKREIDFFMRDWRNDKPRARSTPARSTSWRRPHALLDVSEPYLLLVGLSLARDQRHAAPRSSGAAKNSRHLQAAGQRPAAGLGLSTRWRAPRCRAMPAAWGGIRAPISCTWIAAMCATGGADPRNSRRPALPRPAPSRRGLHFAGRCCLVPIACLTETCVIVTPPSSAHLLRFIWIAKQPSRGGMT